MLVTIGSGDLLGLPASIRHISDLGALVCALTIIARDHAHVSP